MNQWTNEPNITYNKTDSQFNETEKPPMWTNNESIIQNESSKNYLFRRSPRRRRGVLRITATTVFWVLNLCCTNAGVKLPRVARSAWTTCYARPWFWPWFCRWFCVLTLIALNLQNITARSAHCQILFWHQQILDFETQNNQPPFETGKLKSPTILPAPKPLTETTTKKNNPPRLPFQKIPWTKNKWNQEWTDIVLCFDLCVLHNTGVKLPRVARSAWTTC